MNEQALKATLKDLLNLTAENEIVEFKEETGQKAAYSKNKAFDKKYYLDLIEKAITEHSSLKRGEIEELLWKKLPDWMSDEQRKNKVTNLLSELRINNKIQNDGTMKESLWVLCQKK